MGPVRHILGILLAALAAVAPLDAPSGAEPAPPSDGVPVAPRDASPAILQGGLAFSLSGAGAELVSVSGTGTADDPFVVVERVEALPAVLTVRGLERSFGNRARSNHFTAFVLVKVVENATGAPWDGFDIALEETLGRPSDYYDGLSFAQSDPKSQGDFTSAPFAHMRLVEEPSDTLRFEQGSVPAGGAAHFRLIVSHNAPKGTVHLVQRRAMPIAGPARPTPPRLARR